MNSMWGELFVFGAYLFFPLFVSVVIYKLFPETSVGTAGWLGNLKINATGAFAAYVITLIIASWFVRDLELFDRAKKYEWELRGDLEFKDENGRRVMITDAESKDIILTITPSNREIDGTSIYCKIYADETFPKIKIQYPGYIPYNINLDSLSSKDFDNYMIHLGKVVLKKPKSDLDDYNPPESSDMVEIPSTIGSGPPVQDDVDW